MISEIFLNSPSLIAKKLRFIVYITAAVGTVALTPWTLFRYWISCLMVRSEPRSLYLELYDRSEIWREPRQRCCRCVCKISKWCDNLNHQSHDFETLRDLTIRRFIRSWNGAQAVRCYNSERHLKVDPDLIWNNGFFIVLSSCVWYLLISQVGGPQPFWHRINCHDKALSIQHMQPYLNCTSTVLWLKKWAVGVAHANAPWQWSFYLHWPKFMILNRCIIDLFALMNY